MNINYIETMKRALEALQITALSCKDQRDAITNLRAAIDAAEKQEPVAIDYDTDMDRYYIPIHPDWEVQTKGRGSSFRIANTKTGRRWLIIDSGIHAMLEQMARDIHASANPAPTQPDSEQAKDAARDELVAALTKIGEIASPYRDGVKFNYIADIAQAALAKVGAGGTATEGHNAVELRGEPRSGESSD